MRLVLLHFINSDIHIYNTVTQQTQALIRENNCCNLLDACLFIYLW